MPSTTVPRLVAVAALAPLLLVACGGPREPRAAPVPAREVGAFVVRLGADTVAMEEFARTEGRIEGRQLLRTPRTTLREFSASLRPDGTLQRFDMQVRDSAGAPPSMRAEIDFHADTALVRIERDGAVQTQRVPARAGAIPFVGYSLSLYELPFVRLREAGRDTLDLQMVPIGGATAMPLRLVREGDDHIAVHNIAGENRARVDASGRLLTWDGRGTTLDLFADRTFGLDIDHFLREYAARDAAGRGLGALSPRDSAVARVGEASITIAYGRPLARGRQVFGEVVPWGQVWRTGANQATLLRTDRDLVIGGTTVPAGSYSLFTIPSPDGWQLIVNRQTGQWGTAHDPTQDLARIAMQRETLAEAVDQFTIWFEERGAGRAELRMAWDDTRASVPIRLP
jgi:hypothetical protein